jgi:regulator of replication initiation timing
MKTRVTVCVPPTISEQALAEEMMQEMEDKLADMQRRHDHEQRRLSEQLGAAIRERDEMKANLDAALSAQATIELELSKWTGRLVDLCKCTDTQLLNRVTQNRANTDRMRDIAVREASLQEKTRDLRKREEDLCRALKALRAEFQEEKHMQIQQQVAPLKQRLSEALTHVQALDKENDHKDRYIAELQRIVYSEKPMAAIDSEEVELSTLKKCRKQLGQAVEDQVPEFADSSHRCSRGSLQSNAMLKASLCIDPREAIRQIVLW